ncbi:hypothetical protein GCM10023196_038300 [Actinoallomurus vinaceus]|uniref:Uncharacterized protein n=1 Tax=Actinoallomurus vinaceus TaxID=1080074 RepID=A0ABP8UCB3_9ACTN
MIWRLTYTSAARGPTGRSGFQFVAMSPGTPPDVTRAVTPYMTYRPPPGAPSAPGPDALAGFPIALAYGREGPYAVLARCRYTGRDYSGRYGNFLGQAVVATPEEMAGLRPIEFWDSPLWNSPSWDSPLGDPPLGDSRLGDSPPADSGLGDSRLGGSPLGDSRLGDSVLGDSSMGGSRPGDSPLLNAPSGGPSPDESGGGGARSWDPSDGLPPGAAFDPETLVGWLGGERAHDRLAAVLDAVTTVLVAGHGRVVLVAEDAELIARWIAVMSYSLPADLAADLSFITYTADPEAAPYVVVGTVPAACPERGFRLDDPFVRPGTAPSRFAQVIADCWRTGDLAGIDAVGELIGEAIRPDPAFPRDGAAAGVTGGATEGDRSGDSGPVSPPDGSAAGTHDGARQVSPADGAATTTPDGSGEVAEAHGMARPTPGGSRPVPPFGAGRAVPDHSGPVPPFDDAARTPPGGSRPAPPFGAGRAVPDRSGRVPPFDDAVTGTSDRAGGVTRLDGAAALLALCRGDASVSAAEQQVAARLVRDQGVPGWARSAVPPVLPALGFDLAAALADAVPEAAEHCVRLALADPGARRRLPAVRLRGGLPEEFRAAIAEAPDLETLAEVVGLADRVGGALDADRVVAAAAACARRGAGEPPAAVQATPGAWREAMVAGVVSGVESAPAAVRRAMLTPEACAALGDRDWTRAPRTGGLVLSVRADRLTATAELIALDAHGLPDLDELLGVLWSEPPTVPECRWLAERLAPVLPRFAVLRDLPRRVFDAVPLEAGETLRLARLIDERLPDLADAARTVLAYGGALRAGPEEDLARFLAVLRPGEPLAERALAGVARVLAGRSPLARTRVLAAAPGAVRDALIRHWLAAGPDRRARADLAEIGVRLADANVTAAPLEEWADGLGRFARRQIESALADRDPWLAAAWQGSRRRGA